MTRFLNVRTVATVDVGLFFLGQLASVGVESSLHVDRPS